MNKFRLWLIRQIKERRKRRYGKITRHRSDFVAGLQATVYMFESLIMGEKVRWDINYARCDSPIERKLYNALRDKWYQTVTQYQVDRYQIDIAIPELQIAIELDGQAYHSSVEQKKRDRRKDNILRRNDWSVLRFSGTEVNSKLKYVIYQIDKRVEQRL